MPIQTHNPATGLIEKRFEAHTSEEVSDIIGMTHAAHLVLKKWDLDQRSEALNRVATILEEEADILGRIVTLEMGKPLKAAIAEVKKCALGARHYANQSRKYLADDFIETQATRSYRKYLPLGVVLAVMPWNYPIWQVIRFAAPALMAGNGCLLKHASNVPQCALYIETIFKRAGFPENAFRTLLIGGAMVEQVLRDDRVKAATLTGSEPAGASVAAICGSEIKPTLLELGGSDAFIIMPSADLEQAVKIGVKARTQNNGQSCIAAKRFIVHAEIFDEVKAKLLTAFENLKIGDPMSFDTDIGPIVDEKSREEIITQVKNAVSSGANLLTGGEALAGPGWFMSPAILENISPDSAAYREEIFGPVASLYRVNSIDQAIELANDSPFGLGSSIWTTNEEEIEQAVIEIDAGATFVNAMTSSDPRLPFGGIKKSGYGRELAAEGIRTFCNIKTVYIA